MADNNIRTGPLSCRLVFLSYREMSKGIFLVSFKKKIMFLYCPIIPEENVNLLKY